MMGSRCLQGGLDLAGAGLDWSALVVAERIEVVVPDAPAVQWVNGVGLVPADKVRDHYVVRLIRRWPRGTDPGDVLHALGRMLADPALDGARVRWDATGLGGGLRGVVRELTRDGVFLPGQMQSVVITAGESSQVPGGVPKQDLVSGLSRAVHEQRVHVSPACDHAEDLRREANAYVAKALESGRFKYEAAGSGHDDLVTALMLAVFRSMRHGPARRVSRSFFVEQVLTGAEDAPPRVVWPAGRAGEVWQHGQWVAP